MSTSFIFQNFPDLSMSRPRGALILVIFVCFLVTFRIFCSSFSPQHVSNRVYLFIFVCLCARARQGEVLYNVIWMSCYFSTPRRKPKKKNKERKFKRSQVKVYVVTNHRWSSKRQAFTTNTILAFRYFIFMDNSYKIISAKRNEIKNNNWDIVTA